MDDISSNPYEMKTSFRRPSFLPANSELQEQKSPETKKELMSS
jgi:hypothetical protein